ncbi:hypothetical protein ACOSP7_003153 [Xanthoceras sorbifolium]
MHNKISEISTCQSKLYLISQFVNEFIKRSVQQARPETCVLLEMCDSHSWPSSHS